MSVLGSFNVGGLQGGGGGTPQVSVNPGGSASQSAPGMIPGMLGVYNQLLGLNTQNYGNILAGYGNAQGNLGGQLPGIYGGYGQVQKDVLNTLGVGNGGWGVAAPAAEQIREGGIATQGKNQQALIDSGLGNSSLLAQANNQTRFQTGQNYANLGAQLAQTAAGYQSSIGLAGLGAQMQGLGMQNSLAQSYLNNLAGYRFANTAGNLEGQYSSSASQQYPPQSGGGGGGGHGSGGGSAMGQPFGWAAGGGFGYGGTNALNYAGGYTNGMAGYGGVGGFDYSPYQPGGNYFSGPLPSDGGPMGTSVASGDTGYGQGSAYYGE